MNNYAEIKTAEGIVVKAYQLRDLPKGEWFTKKPIAYPKENQVFVRSDYDHALKKYWAHRFSDICDEQALKPTTIVYTDFIF